MSFNCLIVYLLGINLAISSVTEDYKFQFKIVNNTSNRSIIHLILPEDITEIPVQYSNVKDPVLHIAYVADSKSLIQKMKSGLTVKYEDNWTKVYSFNPDNHSEYDCVRTGSNKFSRGACFKGANLILPPNLEVSIFLNNNILYSKADLKEILKNYLPYLSKLTKSNNPVSDCSNL